MIDLSVVVLSWNTRDLLVRCLETAEAEADRCASVGLGVRLVVVDNSSEDGSADVVAERFPDIHLIVNDANRGYAPANNQGVAVHPQSEFVMTLNSDTEVRPGAFEILAGFLRDNPSYGACGPRLLWPDGTTQPACMRFPRLATLFAYDTPLERLWPDNPWMRDYFCRDFDHEHDADVDQPPGACLCLRREALPDPCVAFDEQFWLYYNDVDLCRRLAKSGWKIRCLADAQVVHHKGASTASFPAMARELYMGRIRYYAKHYGPPGRLLARAAARWRAGEELRRLMRVHRHDDEVRQAAVAELEGMLERVMVATETGTQE